MTFTVFQFLFLSFLISSTEGSNFEVTEYPEGDIELKQCSECRPQNPRSKSYLICRDGIDQYNFQIEIVRGGGSTNLLPPQRQCAGYNYEVQQTNVSVVQLNFSDVRCKEILIRFWATASDSSLITANLKVINPTNQVLASFRVHTIHTETSSHTLPSQCNTVNAIIAGAFFSACNVCILITSIIICVFTACGSEHRNSHRIDRVTNNSLEAGASDEQPDHDQLNSQTIPAVPSAEDRESCGHTSTTHSSCTEVNGDQTESHVETAISDPLQPQLPSIPTPAMPKEEAFTFTPCLAYDFLGNKAEYEDIWSVVCEATVSEDYDDIVTTKPSATDTHYLNEM